MLFSEAITQFEKWNKIRRAAETIKGYSLDLRQFCLYMRNPEIEAVTTNDIIEYFDMMSRLGWKWNGFLTKSLALRKFFEFWGLQGYQVLDWRLIPIPKREFNPPRVATEEEYTRLLKVIPEKTSDHRHIRNRALIMMLWDTGARIGELLSLNVDDINFEERNVVIKTEKSQGIKPYRQIFWTEPTNVSLQEWIEDRRKFTKRHKLKDPDALFINVNSWNTGQRFTRTGAATALSRLSTKAGIPTVNAHSFRHRFGLELAKKGANNSTISNLMGHSSLMSSYRYTIMRSNDLADEYQKFMGKKADTT
jgi:integrase/recombinase XerD